MAEVEGAGALKGLGFSSKEYSEAMVRLADAQVVDTTFAGLARDAHSAVTSARAALADKTFKLAQSLRFIVNNPATDPVLRAQAKDAGSELEAQLQSLQTSRQSSRKAGSELRDLQDELDVEKKKNKTHETGEVVRNAQKDLRLQFMSGEPLRPADLVMPPEEAAPEEAQPDPKKGRRRARRS